MIDKVEQTEKVVDLKPADCDTPTRRKGIYLAKHTHHRRAVWWLLRCLFQDLAAILNLPLWPSLPP